MSLSLYVIPFIYTFRKRNLGTRCPVFSANSVECHQTQASVEAMPAVPQAGWYIHMLFWEATSLVEFDGNQVHGNPFWGKLSFKKVSMHWAQAKNRIPIKVSFMGYAYFASLRNVVSIFPYARHEIQMLATAHPVQWTILFRNKGSAQPVHEQPGCSSFENFLWNWAVGRSATS